MKPEMLLEFDAIPALRNAYADAAERISQEITLAEAGLRVPGWANDPVSQDATTRFNDRSLDSANSALAALYAYREQLNIAADNLDRTLEQYLRKDDERGIGLSKQEGDHHGGPPHDHGHGHQGHGHHGHGHHDHGQHGGGHHHHG